MKVQRCDDSIRLMTTTPFTERLERGEDLERRVAVVLRQCGWTAEPFGQATFPVEIRDAMGRSRSWLRHMPDLIAARDGELVTVDCKDRMRSTTTGRYAISRECVSFGLQMAALGVPVFYVFGNLGVLVPTEVMAYGRIGPRATGSGAYYLVSERMAHPFDEVFGSAVAEAA